MNNVIELSPKKKGVETKSTELEQFLHDIKSPLGALKVFLDGSVTPARQNYVNLCLERIEDMICKLEGESDEYSAPLHFREPVKSHSASAMVAELVAEKSAELGLDIKLVATECAETAMVKVQRMEFKRVLSNLMNNAFEACPKGSRIEIDLCAFCIGDQFILEISDNGIGIENSELQSVFKKGHSSKGSTGLGLSHAQSKISSWHGDFTIISQQGQGTTVAISLPLYPAS